MTWQQIVQTIVTIALYITVILVMVNMALLITGRPGIVSQAEKIFGRMKDEMG